MLDSGTVRVGTAVRTGVRVAVGGTGDAVNVMLGVLDAVIVIVGFLVAVDDLEVGCWVEITIGEAVHEAIGKGLGVAIEVADGSAVGVGAGAK